MRTSLWILSLLLVLEAGFLVPTSVFAVVSRTVPDLKVNGKDGPLSVLKDSVVTLSWNGGSTSSCKGNWTTLPITLKGTATSTVSTSRLFTLICTVSGGKTLSDFAVVTTPFIPLVASATSTVVASTTKPVVTPYLPNKLPPCSSAGDVTGDGKVDQTDSDLVQSFADQKASSTPAQVRSADVNRDGSVTSADALLIRAYVLGGEYTLPVCTAIPMSVPIPLPTVDLKVNGSDGPTVSGVRGYITTSWVTTGASSCVTSWNSDHRTVNSGNSFGPVLAPLVMTLTCADSENRAVRDSITVQPETAIGTPVVDTTPPLPLPVVNLKVNDSDGPLSLSYGSEVTLSWTISNAVSCSNNWNDKHDITNGGATYGSMTAGKTFVLSCSNGKTLVTDSVLVNITPPTAFLFPSNAPALWSAIFEGFRSLRR